MSKKKKSLSVKKKMEKYIFFIELSLHEMTLEF